MWEIILHVCTKKHNFAAKCARNEQLPRSGKQNIVEGSADGMTSTEMELKLLNYQSFFEKWTDEEMANIALTLCHMVDKMMTTYEKQLEKTFIEEGGIKERMTAARLGYRSNQKKEIAQLRQELEQARRRIAELEAKLAKKEQTG